MSLRVIYRLDLSLLAIVLGILCTLLFAYLIKKEERKKKDLNKDSVIVISGACEGIGRKLALLFACNHQCNVVIYDNKKNSIKPLLNEISQFGAKAHFYECDFDDKNDILKAIAQTLAKFGFMDLFINTGGVSLEQPFGDYSHEELAYIMKTNFLAPTILIKEILEIMKKQNKGHIVNVPCELKTFYSPDTFTYSGTKGGLNKLLKGLQAYLKKEELNVKITIVRALISTAKLDGDQDIPSQLMDRYANRIYNGIMSEDEEI